MSCSATQPADSPHFEPAWLTETVLALARGVAADLKFDRLPILADALEDAGCDNFPLLHHLRSPVAHRVECWALRRLLRTPLILPGDVPITFAYCPPGSFLMGSDHPEARDDERPVHRVRLTQGFYIGIVPVTEEQWRSVMGPDQPRSPRRDLRDNYPVTMVSWVDSQEWCFRASEQTGVRLRLPTEAEWEYACRAGVANEIPFGNVHRERTMRGDPRIAPSGTPTPDLTSIEPVGKYPPNPWGLFDCFGTVMQWCFDLYEPDFYAHDEVTDPVCRESRGHRRVVRGGSSSGSMTGCRSAWRWHQSLANSRSDLGFRVVFTAG